MMSGTDMKKAAELFTELRDYLVSLNDSGLYYQTRYACGAVRSLEAAEDAGEAEEIIRRAFRGLFPARGGLSDVVLWDGDQETRAAINEPLRRIEKELRTIVALHAAD